jgi:hypothetical protein
MRFDKIPTECGDDAAKWAKAFCDRYEVRHGHKINESMMTGWFANAIEHSHDLRSGRIDEAPAAVVDTLQAYDSLSQFYDFLNGVGEGYGSDWRGILFRTNYADIDDAIVVLRRLGAEISCTMGDYAARWPDGEFLLLRAQPSDEAQVAAYHGHTYAWMGWDSPDTFPLKEAAQNAVMLRDMMRVLRSTTSHGTHVKPCVVIRTKRRRNSLVKVEILGA